MSNVDGLRELNIENPEVAASIWNLQQAAYLVEADLIGSKDIPPLKESQEELMASEETFLGYFIAGELVAILSYKRYDGEIDIHRMMVHPHHFRKGIAICLLEFLERSEKGVQKFLVSTGAANGPAIRLYKKLGFEFIDETVVEQGLRLAHLKKSTVE